MPELTPRDFAQLVVKSGLIKNEALKPAVAVYNERAVGKKADWRLLSRVLIERGLLTPWQAGKIAKGLYKGFFIGKYKLLGHLGSGGMSSVYLAEHTVMMRRVALKILPKRLVEDPVHLGRFYVESQATAALDHPNIVRAYDFDNEGQIHYLVMEYVDGADLERRVQKDGPLSLEAAIDFVHQAAEGLAHAHAKGMVHRDIKPANLLVNSENVVKILDMGLATLGTFDGGSDQPERHVVGTAEFLAPEQALGQTVDGRADVYSLGCTLYYLMAGRPPFLGESMAEIILKHQVQQPQPLVELRPDLPPDVAEILAHMMAKKPEERCTSSDVVERLADWLHAHHAWHAEHGQGSDVSGEIRFRAQLVHDHEDRVNEPPPPPEKVNELASFLQNLQEEADEPSVDAGSFTSFLSGLPATDSSPSGAGPRQGDTVTISKQRTSGPDAGKPRPPAAPPVSPPAAAPNAARAPAPRPAGSGAPPAVRPPAAGGQTPAPLPRP
ncbi:MAG TPA: serine/threonine-protein kinase, partial [Pirellulales bacterium]